MYPSLPWITGVNCAITLPNIDQKNRKQYGLAGQQQKRILIIDDEADVNTVVREVLELNGFTVDSYEDPLLALDKFKPHFYGLLIIDIKMPELNGFALYREIKKLDENVKVCFFTALTERYNVTYSDIISSIPANCFIQKPVTNEELLKQIKAIVDDRGKMCE